MLNLTKANSEKTKTQIVAEMGEDLARYCKGEIQQTC